MIQELREMIEKHVQETGSEKGQRILDHFEDYLPKFKKIIPIDYKKMVTLEYKTGGKGNVQRTGTDGSISMRVFR